MKNKFAIGQIVKFRGICVIVEDFRYDNEYLYDLREQYGDGEYLDILECLLTGV